MLCQEKVLPGKEVIVIFPTKRYSDKRRYCLHPYPLGTP